MTVNVLFDFSQVCQGRRECRVMLVCQDCQERKEAGVIVALTAVLDVTGSTVGYFLYETNYSSADTASFDLLV